MKKTPNTSGIRYPVCVQGPHRGPRGFEVADATGLEQIAADLTQARAYRVALALNATRHMSNTELRRMAEGEKHDNVTV